MSRLDIYHQMEEDFGTDLEGGELTPGEEFIKSYKIRNGEIRNGEVSETGSKRFNEGKPQFSQLDPRFIEGIIALMTKGEKKYGKYNWAKGQKYSTVLDSLFRHYIAITKGEDVDPESGELHLFHIAANCMLLFNSMNVDNMDDRFFKEKK